MSSVGSVGSVGSAGSTGSSGTSSKFNYTTCDPKTKINRRHTVNFERTPLLNMDLIQTPALLRITASLALATLLAPGIITFLSNLLNLVRQIQSYRQMTFTSLLSTNRLHLWPAAHLDGPGVTLINHRMIH